jgi:outer membrane lipopolysaccharide assembly protein LptE/RlpB
MNKKYWFFILLLLPLLSLACGYHFSPGGEHIDKNIRMVFVENFKNQTSEANIENYIRNAIINAFRKRSRFDLADSKDTSDAYISGSVNRSDISHLSYTRTDVAKEDETNLTLEITFKTTSNNEIIWANSNFTGKEAFLVNSDPNRTERNRKNALKKLADDMAERAYRNIMSGF